MFNFKWNVHCLKRSDDLELGVDPSTKHFELSI